MSGNEKIHSLSVKDSYTADSIISYHTNKKYLKKGI